MAFEVPTYIGAGDAGNDLDTAAWPKVIAAIEAANYGQLQGFKNRLRNGSFRLATRTAASNADDTYTPLDGWYALTQTGAIAVTQQADQEAGSPNSGRLTQSQASAQRMGLAQIVESVNCRDFRGAPVAFSGRVRLSTAADVRYAILEWTGAFDTVTSDVVADWTNASYTAGAFFNSTTLNVLAVGEVSCAAATWRDLTAITATVGASAQNLIVVVWTEGTVAQNVTLDLGRLQLEPGVVASKFENRPASVETALCQRYFQVASYGAAGRATSATATLVGAPFPTKMRSNPTVAIVNTSVSMRINGASSSSATGAAIVNSGATPEGYFIQMNGFSGLTGGDTVHCNSQGAFSFDAEL